uniref:Glutaredoxin-like protein n=1 Tax=Quercus lobata TaxID=97700 RepID=A0A7N2ML36_QUELO
MAMAAMARPSSIVMLTVKRQRPRWVFTPLALSLSSSSPTPSRKLILYSKPGCCLCDGLKEKLQAAFLISGPDSLHDVDLQIRDITSNSEWERAYQYEIPVLAKVRPDGTETLSTEVSSTVPCKEKVYPNRLKNMNKGNTTQHERSEWTG